MTCVLQRCLKEDEFWPRECLELLIVTRSISARLVGLLKNVKQFYFQRTMFWNCNLHVYECNLLKYGKYLHLSELESESFAIEMHRYRYIIAELVDGSVVRRLGL